MTISYLHVGVLEHGDMQKGGYQNWCKESRPCDIYTLLP